MQWDEIAIYGIMAYCIGILIYCAIYMADKNRCEPGDWCDTCPFERCGDSIEYHKPKIYSSFEEMKADIYPAYEDDGKILDGMIFVRKTMPEYSRRSNNWKKMHGQRKRRRRR